MENFVAFTKSELVAMPVKDITSETFNGQVDDVIFDEYYKVTPYTAFSTNELVTNTVEDMSDQYQF